MNTTKPKTRKVYVNLYVEYPLSPNETTDEGGQALEHMLNNFAVDNQNLIIKYIKAPECPPDSDLISIPPTK